MVSRSGWGDSHSSRAKTSLCLEELGGGGGGRGRAPIPWEEEECSLSQYAYLLQLPPWVPSGALVPICIGARIPHPSKGQLTH